MANGIDLLGEGELQLPMFQLPDLPGMPDMPAAGTGTIARHRERQIERRRQAAAVFRQTVGSATRQSFTREGERPVEGQFEAVQDLPEAEPQPNFAEEFNVFLQQFLDEEDN